MGVSIWLPGKQDHEAGSQAYNQLTMSRQTKWDELIDKVLKARGYIKFAGSPMAGPYTGLYIYHVPVSELEAGEGLTSEYNTGIVVGKGTNFVITDLPLTEPQAIGLRLREPRGWVSPPRWKIEIGGAAAAFLGTNSVSENAQASRAGWRDEEGQLFNQWLPFKVDPDGKVSVLNVSRQLGL